MAMVGFLVWVFSVFVQVTFATPCSSAGKASALMPKKERRPKMDSSTCRLPKKSPPHTEPSVTMRPMKPVYAPDEARENVEEISCKRSET